MPLIMTTAVPSSTLVGLLIGLNVISTADISAHRINMLDAIIGFPWHLQGFGRQLPEIDIEISFNVQV